MSTWHMEPAMILVVDADPTIRMLLQDVLIDEGYQVAAGTLDALQGGALAAVRPELLLVELSQPSSGATLELLAQLNHEAAAGLPPIVFTVTDRRLAERLDQRLPLTRCAALSKPFSLDALSDAVHQALGAHPCRRGEAAPPRPPTVEEQPRQAS